MPGFRTLACGLSLVVLLLEGHARSTTCVPLPAPWLLWPGNMRDVSRLVHPLISGVHSGDRIRLLDLGPRTPTDDLASEPWTDRFRDARQVSFHVRPVPELGSNIKELVPDDGPLPASHHFAVVSGERFVTSFATRERTETAPSPQPPAFVIEVRAPDAHPGPFGGQQDTTVVLHLFAPARPGHLFVLSLARDDVPAGRHLGIADDRTVSFGPGPCGTTAFRFPGPGWIELLVREWGPGGISPPERVVVRVPAPLEGRN